MSHFSEHLIMEGFGYSFGLAVADLTGDDSLDMERASKQQLASHRRAPRIFRMKYPLNLATVT